MAPDRPATFRLKVTDEQRRAIHGATGKDAAALELDV
jgi:hypothetical protein